MLQDDLQPQITTDVAIDRRGFVRISGVCIGRRICVDAVTYFEVKDRNRNRSAARGAQLLRVRMSRFLADLTSPAE